MKTPLTPEIQEARDRFKQLMKDANAVSYQPVSLAADWTGRGFKDTWLDTRWTHFLDGWNQARKPRPNDAAITINEAQARRIVEAHSVCWSEGIGPYMDDVLLAIVTKWPEIKSEHPHLDWPPFPIVPQP